MRMPPQTSILATLIILAASTFASGPHGARASGFTVDSQTDAVDAVVGDGACATPTGECSLRAAIQETNALAGAGSITLPPGVYSLTIPGAAEDLSTAGDLDINDDLTIAGAGATGTVVDATGLDRALHIVNPAAHVSLSGLAVQNGRTGPAEEGGGILSHGNLDLSDSLISGNAADPNSGNGGGIFNRGTMTLTDSVVSDNASWIGGGVANFQTATIIRSRITGNASLDTCCFLGAGGIGNVGTLVLIDSEVSANIAVQAAGIGNVGFVTIIGSTISGNIAGGLGGGIGSGGGDIFITDSTVSGNTAVGRGAGIGHLAGTLTVVNTTVSGNATGDNGGGINAIGVTVNLNNVTITNNTADSDADGSGDGGGINASGGVYTIANTIIAGNSDRGEQAPDCSGPVISEGYNLIQNTSGCTVLGDTTGNITNHSAGLGSLADNGGPTQTHALLAASLAIDAGSTADVGGGDGACEATDQRGVPRPQDGDANREARCDIGAFEVGAFTSTLGKVTGGGSIASSSGSGTAGFGFSVKAVTAASGSGQALSGALVYEDEGAGVEISGARFDQLTIDGTHAEFTGTAAVNGVSKRIRVTVNDLGEPGSADTFGIEVLDATYSNSGRMSGGNIKIHK